MRRILIDDVDKTKEIESIKLSNNTVKNIILIQVKE